MKAKKILFSLFASMLVLFAMSASVFAGEAKIGDTSYNTLAEAINSIDTSEEIIAINLTSDVNLENSLEISGGKKFKLNLNGHTISAPEATLVIQNANVTITGTGTIKETSPNLGAVILKGANTSVANYTKVVIDKNVTLEGWSPLFIREYEKGNNNSAYGIVADVYGTLNGVNDKSGAIGNGIYINGSISATENCPIINIYPSAKISGTDIGISALGQAIWNIYGGKISGQTAIYQKAGQINIFDGEFSASGENKDYEYNGNGCNSTGDAIVVDSCSYPSGVPSLNIYSGIFSSKNNNAVASYTYNNASSGEISIFAGEFTSDPTKFLKTNKDVSNIDNKYIVPIVTVDDDPCGSFLKALEIVNDGETIKMLENISLTEQITLSAKAITLDLNGKKLSSSAATGFRLNPMSKFTLDDTSKVKGEYVAEYIAFRVYGDKDNNSNITELIIKPDVIVKSKNMCCVFIVQKGAKLITDGTLSAWGEYATIQGNGLAESAGVEVYINGGAVSSSDKACAIYFPSSGILSVSGDAYVIGKSAIYQKSGGLTVGGNAKIEAIGNNDDYVYSGDGCNLTGDAIIIDSCGYPGGAPKVSITGGCFKSLKNKAIGSYVKDDNYTKITGFVSGGYFTSDPTEFLAEGKIAVKSDNKDYLYMVVDKDPNITVETKAEGFETLVSGDSSIEGIGDVVVSFLNTDYMKSMVATLANDPSFINSEAAIEAAQKISGYASGESKVVVTIKPYMEVEIVGYESGENEKALTLDITPKYNIVVSLSGDSSESITLVSGETMSITDSVQIGIKLPAGFAPANTTIYINHKGYIYIAWRGIENSFTFTNPDGFSRFVVKTTEDTVANRYKSSENPQGISIAYDTLAGAIKEANNDDIIGLKKDTAEVVTVNRVVTFTFDTKDKNFSGEIKAGSNVELTITDGNTPSKKVYTFTAKEEVPSEEKPVGGSSSTIVKYTVKFETNCDSKIENVSVERNEKVKEPKAPVREGYSFVGWYTDKDCTNAYDFDSKVTSPFTLYAKWVEVVEQWKNPFEDVNENQWFYEAVEFANKKSLFNGMSSTKFGPDVSMTRAMLVTVLYRWAGEPEVSGVSKFADVVKGSYYEKALIWAEKNGIVTGVTETEFKPDMEITREQIIVIMFRFANYMKFDVSVGEDTNILSYEDFNEISEYAIPAIQWAVGANLVKGNTASTLDPRSNTTRAQVATILQRFIENN